MLRKMRRFLCLLSIVSLCLLLLTACDTIQPVFDAEQEAEAEVPILEEIGEASAEGEALSEEEQDPSQVADASVGDEENSNQDSDSSAQNSQSSQAPGVGQKQTGASNQSEAVKAKVNEVWKLTNTTRSNKGTKKALVLDEKLCYVAQIRANEVTQLFSHNRPNGKSGRSVLDENGIRYSAWGENIAAGQKTAAKVVEDWVGSPGHLRNITNSSYTKMGIGVKEMPGGGYAWVQIFTN